MTCTLLPSFGEVSQVENPIGMWKYIKITGTCSSCNRPNDLEIKVKAMHVRTLPSSCSEDVSHGSLLTVTLVLESYKEEMLVNTNITISLPMILK